MAAEIESLRSQLAAKEEVVSNLESDVVKLESNVSSLESNITSLESNITNLESTVSKLESELTWLRKKLFGKMSGDLSTQIPTPVSWTSLANSLATMRERNLRELQGKSKNS